MSGSHFTFHVLKFEDFPHVLLYMSKIKSQHGSLLKLLHKIRIGMTSFIKNYKNYTNMFHFRSVTNHINKLLSFFCWNKWRNSPTQGNISVMPQ